MASVEDIKNELEDAKKLLKEAEGRVDAAMNEADKEFWQKRVELREVQVIEWGEKLRQMTGNDFVTMI